MLILNGDKNYTYKTSHDLDDFIYIKNSIFNIFL